MESKDRKPHDYPHLRISEPALDNSASGMSDSTQRVRAEPSLSDGSKQHRHQGVAAFEFHTMSVTSVSKHCGNSSGEMVDRSHQGHPGHLDQMGQRELWQ